MMFWLVLKLEISYNRILYINSLRLSVCDGGFEGWGKGEAGEATGDPWRDPCQSVTGCGFHVTMQAPVL